MLPREHDSTCDHNHIKGDTMTIALKCLYDKIIMILYAAEKKTAVGVVQGNIDEARELVSTCP